MEDLAASKADDRPSHDVAATAAGDLARVVLTARQDFVADFPGHCATLADFARDASPGADAQAEAVKLLHRLAGLGGTVGFDRVSVKAAAIEETLRRETAPSESLAAALDELRQAFDADNAEPRRPAAVAPGTGDLSLNVLLVEDNVVQRTVLAGQLRMAGHRPVAVATGEEALAAARASRPDVIILDLELPGIDGLKVCQMVKADPALARIPVAILTARTAVDDRLMGLSQGADDFLTKPLDPRELVLRLELLHRHRTPSAVEPTSVELLSFDSFRSLAAAELMRTRAALALIRTPADKTSDVAAFIRDEIRRRDLCGEYDRTHVVVLMPDTSATAACQRITSLVEKCLSHGVAGVYAGVAGAESGGARTLDVLLDEADEALACARYEKRSASIRKDRSADDAPAAATAQLAPLVLIADDDPDVVRILDAHLRAGGFRRAIAFDGSRALEEIRAQRPDVVVLDLMMPRLTGFDVLAGLRDLEGYRPRTIVLSARGREDDVIRAFSVGADDFMTKPFNPQELLARVGRLVS